MIYFVIDADLTVLSRILPIASGIYKKNGSKISFVITRKTLNGIYVDDLMYHQKFVNNVIVIDSLNDLEKNDDNYLVFDEIPNSNITSFYVQKFSLEEDKDFVLNLNSIFNYESKDLYTSKDLSAYFPNFKVADDENNLLTILERLDAAKEIHINNSHIAHLLDLAKIRFYLYIDNLKEEEISNYFWGNFSEAKILDIRKMQDNKIVSCYNLIYFF